jgi:two-component system cell cycle sensor histidine kinase/response regulator CckA
MLKRERTKELFGSEETQEALRALDRPYRLLFERNPQPMWVYDVETLVFLAVNLAAIEQYGYSRNEFLQMTIRDIRPAQDIPSLSDIISRQCEGLAKSSKCKHYKKDGSIIDVEIMSNDLDWSGHSARLVLATDITVRTRAEEQLSKSEESYRQFVEESPDAVLVHRQGKIIFANRACVALFDASSTGELLGKQILDFVHPEDREDVRQKIREYNRDFTNVRYNETRLIGLSGKETYTEVLACSIMYHGKAAIQVNYRDISLRKQAEKKLLESEASLAIAQQVAHLGSWERDLSNTDSWEEGPVRWSDETFRILGYNVGGIEMSRANFVRSIHPDDRDHARELMAAALREGRPYNNDYRIILPNGTERNLHAQAKIVYDKETNRPSKIVGIIHDVTERKKAEERFYKAFNANPEPMTIATLSEGRFIDVNESFLRVTGHQREGVIGRTSLEVNFWKSPEDRASYAEVLEKQGETRDREIAFLTKSGEERAALDSADVVEFDGEKCVIATFKDITDRKNLEKQLRQAQKMEAIGQLSGGIAHDFNNLLGVIIGYCEILEERLPAGDSLQKCVHEIKKAGTRAASLTRQLLAFSRQQVLEPNILALNAIVGNVEKMLGRLLGEDIDIESALERGVGNIKADQGQIEQVIINLAVNARDAMPHGGRLTILTANVDLDEEYARSHPPQPPGRYVLLSVSDTGIGMDAATQAHIFEPFFTTKEQGKGTGLGLSTVYGVIRQSGGHIWVYSEPGFGTTFKIYLPRTEEAARCEIPTAGSATPLHAAETILLVEDEESLRELTRSLLADNGYTVLSAGQPADAIEIARQYKGPIHLLLTDVVMPGMSGLVLAGKLAPAWPDMKVVYMSGYTAFTHPKLFDSDATVLSKPVARDMLLRKVHEVLAAEVVSPSI